MTDYDKIQKALDDLALALPENYHWPRELRRSYERATKSIARLKMQAKKNPAKVT